MTLRIVALILLLSLGQGCGQTGPLYLPGDEPPIYVPDEDNE